MLHQSERRTEVIGSPPMRAHLQTRLNWDTTLSGLVDRSKSHLEHWVVLGTVSPETSSTMSSASRPP